MLGGPILGSADGAGASIGSKAVTASVVSGLGTVSGSQGGVSLQTPTMFRAPVTARVAGQDMWNYFFASPDVPTPLFV